MKTVTAPDSLAELLTDPQRVRDAFALLNALAEMQVVLVVPGGSAPLAPGNKTLRGEPPNIIMPLPLKCTRAISDSTATAASVSTQLNLLLAELRKTGQLPT